MLKIKAPKADFWSLILWGALATATGMVSHVGFCLLFDLL